MPPSLTPELLVWAYSQGLFPMARSRRGQIDWYSPDPRTILPLDAVHVPKSLARRVRSGRFTIRVDCEFEQVVRSCAAPRTYQKHTWINEPIIKAYTQLHQLGLAHSVEAWIEPKSNSRKADAGSADENSLPQLVGGLYGVSIGGAFFGESMFSRATDASKVCLVHLVEHLRQRGFILLDTQINNPHIKQFGSIEILRDDYLARLAQAIALDVTW